MSSLHGVVIGVILLFPWGILAVTIVGSVITTWARWFRAALHAFPSYARFNRSILWQVSGRKTLRA